MPVLRVVWWVLAIVALALTVWVGYSPVSTVSMGCAKIGELDVDGAPASARCSDPIVEVLGVWPLVWLGLSLVAPPAVAALAQRWWVSWMAVAALVVASIVGLVNWASYGGMLLAAVPLSGIALVVAIVQQRRHIRLADGGHDRRARCPSEGGRVLGAGLGPHLRHGGGVDRYLRSGAGAEPDSETGHVAPAEQDGGSEPAAPAGPGGRFEPVAPDEGAGGPGPEPDTPGALDAEPGGSADAAPAQAEPAGGVEEPAPAEELLLLIGLAGATAGASRFRTRHGRLGRFGRRDAASDVPSIGPADGKWVRDPNPLPSNDLPYGPFADEYIALEEPIYGGWSSPVRAGKSMDQTGGDAYTQYQFRIVSMTAQEVHIVEDEGQYYKETYYSYNYEMMKSIVVQQNVAGQSALYPLPSEWEAIDAEAMHEIIRSNPEARFYVPSAR